MNQATKTVDLHLVTLYSLQIALISTLGFLNIGQSNPDAISYLQLGSYYANGQFDLAVSGYWGPLLSWLIVPFIIAGLDPVVAMRITLGLSAVFFSLAATRIFVNLGLNRAHIYLATACCIAYSSFWSAFLISPDLLVSALILKGWAGLSFESQTDRLKKESASGVFFGLAYLAKAIALPAAILFYLAIFWSRCTRLDSPSISWRLFPVRALLITFVVSAPWIAIQSGHYGHFTFSTSGKIAHAISGPGAKLHIETGALNKPEPGRVTAWEDPDPDIYDYWNPLHSRENFIHQMGLVKENLAKVAKNLFNFDLFGLGMILTLLIFALNLKRCLLLRTPLSRLWSGGLGIMVLLLPVYGAEPRYLISIYPLILGTALIALANTHSIPEAIKFDQYFGHFSGRAVKAAASLLIVTSFLWSPSTSILRIYDSYRNSQPGRLDSGKKIAAQLEKIEQSEGSMAVIGHRPNECGDLLYAAFVRQKPFIGFFSSKDLYSLKTLPEFICVTELSHIKDDISELGYRPSLPLNEKSGVSIYQRKADLIE